jgi:L-ascorbate metabolism protein UlaG (beta-lactamase superfamily)
LRSRGSDLLQQIENSRCERPAIWWLGHSGFVLKYRSSIFYIDPYLSDSLSPSRPRLTEPPVRPDRITHASLVLCTHAHADHLDPGTVPAILEASRRAKLVIPKAVAEHAHSLGISFHRMVTTDSSLRVEYLDDRIYSAPSAHNELDWTPLGGYPYLGYLVRFGGCTIYHAGDCIPYPGLADRLRPYTVTVALLPISGRKPGTAPGNFEIAEAAQLAEDIGARWLVPMHYGMFRTNSGDVEGFIDHLLGQRPSQPFKVFASGEKWEVPAE